MESSSTSLPSSPEFEMDEALAMLESLSLTSFMRCDYLIISRQEFDLTVFDEPYIALMLLYNMKSGRFLARLWNKTVASGRATTLDELSEVCEGHFSQGKLCLGCPESEEEQMQHHYLVSQSPIPRRISRACNGFVCDTSSNALACKKCANMNGPPPLTNASFEPRLPQQTAELSKKAKNLKTRIDKLISQNEAIVEGVKVEAAMDDEDIMADTLEEEAMQGAYQMVECEYEEHPGTEGSGEERASTSHEQLENCNKPPFTYAQLIIQALRTEKDLGLPLIDIYSFINQEYPYYKMENKNWQNSIRHNLTLNTGFEKVPNSKGTRGNCWRMKNGFNFEEIMNRKSRWSHKNIIESSSGQDPLDRLSPFEEECEYEEQLGIELSGEERASTSHEQQENYYKPPFTYVQLIVQALMTGNDLGLPLVDIYSFISQKYPYYKMENQNWQNAIRHNLSLNKARFEKVPNPKGVRGNCWRMKDGFNFEGIMNRKRKSRWSHKNRIEISSGHEFKCDQ